MGTFSERREAERNLLEQAKSEVDERNAALMACLLDLTYPVAKDGTRVDLTAFKHIIAYHLVRCGWRMQREKRMIKSRKVNARGVYVDANEWVPIDMPDDPLDNLANMTMAEIDQLPPGLKAEAMQRITGEVLPDLPENTGWKVETRIRITDESDEPEDGFEWT
jgi:hypothetical protein